MSQPIQGRSRAFGGIVIALLLFFGVQLWFVVMHAVGIRRYQPTMIAVIAVIIALIRPVARGVTALLDHIRRPSPRIAFIISICIFIAASLFFYFQAVEQKRDFGLKYQDDYSYQIQTRMVARRAGCGSRRIRWWSFLNRFSCWRRRFMRRFIFLGPRCFMRRASGCICHIG